MNEKINWKTEKRKLSELKPCSWNPRQANEKETADLTQSLERFNLADPIIINTNNEICGGHFRYKILKDKNKDLTVDVRVPDRKLTDAEMRELNIRLNKNSGSWNFDLLANFDEDLLKNIGFQDFELGKFSFENKEKEIEKLNTENECPKCGYKW